LGGAVDLLEGMIELAVVKGDDRLAEGGGLAGVEGRVPLAVFVAEADDDDVGVADQRRGADRVDAGSLVIAPEGLALLPPQRPGAGSRSRGRKKASYRRISAVSVSCYRI